MSEPISLVFLGSPKMVDLPTALREIFKVTSEFGFEYVEFKAKSASGDKLSWGADASQEEVIAKAIEFESVSFEVKKETISPSVLNLHFALGWGKAQLGDADRLWLYVFSHQIQMFVSESFLSFRDMESFHPDVHCRLLLDYGKALYAILLPTFGWSDIEQPAGYTWYTDLENDSIEHWYWANFFSLAYVEKIGRSKILNTRAWLVEELSDGGILCVVSPTPGEVP